jgi:hypothetical protein
MTPNIPEAIRGHDIGDVCDRIWAKAFGTVALAVPAEPKVSALTGFDQLSQEERNDDAR